MKKSISESDILEFLPSMQNSKSYCDKRCKFEGLIVSDPRDILNIVYVHLTAFTGQGTGKFTLDALNCPLCVWKFNLKFEIFQQIMC